MPHIKLIGRNSKLSLVQLQLVQQKIEALPENYTVEIITKSSLGDELKNIPLQTVEGSDFFTKDIYEALLINEADIAVHSLKDMSHAHFFCGNSFAVVDRDDVRDVAIFNPTILEKITRGEPIVIGTCSPRRELMATQFLQKALPQLHDSICINTKPIRGNVETRLQKLNSGQYDATILATAGLNRLLRIPEYAALLTPLLANKKLMLLPLFDCVPAPCQGAIVAEALPNNELANRIIESINQPIHFANCVEEKKVAHKYGSGCNMPFGVVSIFAGNNQYIYAAGNNANNSAFTNWKVLPTLNSTSIFSSTSFMKKFFTYQYSNTSNKINTPIAYIANYKAVTNQLSFANNTILVASGTKTWLHLAKQGHWVTASADALGFEQIEAALQMPLFNFSIKNYTIVTNTESAHRWQQKGIAAIGTYILQPTNDTELQEQIAKADTVFWSSFFQYQHYKQYCKPNCIHACSSGETAVLLQQQGIQPIIFPTLQSFQQWKEYNIQ